MREGDGLRLLVDLTAQPAAVSSPALLASVDEAYSTLRTLRSLGAM